MVSKIIINEDLEEKINYPDRRWPHVILHTSLVRHYSDIYLYISIMPYNLCMSQTV